MNEKNVKDETVRSAPRRIRPPQVSKPAREVRPPETSRDAVPAESPETPPETLPQTPQQRLAEIRRGYRQGPEDDGIDPTRFGDWEYGGRCTDF